uniref:Uncharacterized protein n=1 Tax=viral metagenome TaxID=1070528 RepID=A0A6C0F6J7_9ZZZZ
MKNLLCMTSRTLMIVFSIILVLALFFKKDISLLLDRNTQCK